MPKRRTVPRFVWLGTRAHIVMVCLAITSVAQAQSIPTPESVLGFTIGHDFHLASYEESIRYFQALDEASDRLTLQPVGETSEGRPFYLALVSSADNLANLDRYREVSQRPAHRRGGPRP